MKQRRKAQKECGLTKLRYLQIPSTCAVDGHLVFREIKDDDNKGNDGHYNNDADGHDGDRATDP